MLCSCGDQTCGAVGKHPLTPHGLKDATSDPAELGRWWRRWPQANIGLLTGEVADVPDMTVYNQTGSRLACLPAAPDQQT
jgi:hypothetical protein